MCSLTALLKLDQRPCGFIMAPKYSPKKRAVSKNAGAGPAAIPRAASLAPLAAAGPPLGSNLPATAPLHLSVFRYTDNAGDLSQPMPEEPLWQVQCVHEARPSHTTKLLGAFSRFFETKHGANPEFPSSLSKLKTEAGIQIQIASDKAGSNHRVVPWRVAFYILDDNDSLKNSMALLLEFFEFRRSTAEPHYYVPAPIDLRVAPIREPTSKLLISYLALPLQPAPLSPSSKQHRLLARTS